MKLKQFEQHENYRFLLRFDNGEVAEADLQELIGAYVNLDQLGTACIDPEWGCLAFNQGRVDIDPQTLYKFAMAASQQQAA